MNIQRVTKYSLIFFAALLVLLFQNCGQLNLDGQFGQFGIDLTNQQSGNGDGYAGVQFLYPPETESGSIFSVEPTGLILEGFSFELLVGDSRIETLDKGIGAVVYVDPGYIGNLIIRATALTGEVKDLEIQVVEPLAVNSNFQNQTFGSELRVSGKRIAVASPKKNIDGYINAGKVTIYGINPETKNVFQVQNIVSPVLTDQFETKFGQSMASTKEELFISSPTLNQIYHYRIERRPGKVNRYNLIQTIGEPQSVSFGASMWALPKFLIVADRGFDDSKGKVIVFSRDGMESDSFSKQLEIVCPSGYVNCGRNVRKNGPELFVSARRQQTGRNEGVLLRLDMQGNLIQAIEAPSARFNFAEESKHVGDFLVVSQPNRGTTELKEFLAVFRLNSSNNMYELVQEINHPFLEVSKDSFGISMAGNSKFLFVGAPRANSFRQERSGKVYMYEFNLVSNQFEFKGNITPNFADGSDFRGFGRSLKVNKGVLFVSCSVQEEDRDHRTGTLYHLIFSAPE